MRSVAVVSESQKNKNNLRRRLHGSTHSFLPFHS